MIFAIHASLPIEALMACTDIVDNTRARSHFSGALAGTKAAATQPHMRAELPAATPPYGAG